MVRLDGQGQLILLLLVQVSLATSDERGGGEGGTREIGRAHV